ncbi:MAG TPA: class I SAM-dependent methyltransferase [Vicinamibacterales bacterium]|nr:class I SAM-dependent methyltransferase [Vicinamibacterales bacterium]
MDDAERPDLDLLTTGLFERHLHTLTTPEFLRAARALSARYVEARQRLHARSPLDSAGKRAAFAVLYGAIHYETTRAITRELGLASNSVGRIVDLGCGTGAASAGWARASTPRPSVEGIDRSGWAVTEARWTWSRLGLTGRATRGDLVAAAERLTRQPRQALAATGVLLAWAVNELVPRERDPLLAHLMTLGQLGARVLVIEPVSGRAAPWWDTWARAVVESGGRADAWQVPNTLPAALRRLDRQAGFDRPHLSARSLLLPA